jgi:hypothetical protein
MYEISDFGYSVIDILDYFFNFVKLTPSLEENIKYKIIPFLCFRQNEKINRRYA